MNRLGQLIKELVEDRVGEIHTTLPAKIESYDSQELRADVVILARQELEGEAVEIPPIINCPVEVLKAGNFCIIPPYQKGDVVKVVFSQKALDKLLITGSSENPEFKRKHSLDDAIVTGGLKVEQSGDLPNVGENLYIGDLSGNIKIEITPSSEISIVCDSANVESDQVSITGSSSVDIQGGVINLN